MAWPNRARASCILIGENDSDEEQILEPESVRKRWERLRNI